MKRTRIWQALLALDFLSAFFSWFFMLLSRLSEPLMLLATLYIVAEAGVPSVASPLVHNLALGVMITAPEIILPGSFVVAARSGEQAGRYARLLFLVCWLFVLLTLVTLVSLFVWHLAGQSLAWLMCARCAVAVGYSILMRVMNHGQVVQSQEEQVVQTDRVNQQILELAEGFTQQLQVVQMEMLNQVQTLVQTQVEGQVAPLYDQLVNHLDEAREAMRRDMRLALSEATVREPGGSKTGSKTGSSEPARRLHPVPVVVHVEPGSELVETRVKRFILDRLNQQGSEPSLSEIMAACTCSRGTAVKYRREVLGEERALSQEKSTSRIFGT